MITIKTDHSIINILANNSKISVGKGFDLIVAYVDAIKEIYEAANVNNSGKEKES